MRESNNNSRLNKFEKRRKNTKRITYLSILAAVIFLFLIGSFVFGSKDKTKETKQPTPTEQPKDNKEDDNKSTDDENKNEENKDEDSNEQKDDEANDEDEDSNAKKETEDDGIVTETVDPSDDNVAHAFTANWDPIGTEQSGEHHINLDSGTQDRKEIEEAIQVATGLENMTVWWLTRGGDTDLVSTVSNKQDESEIYRVYLNWVDNEGWQPKKVELLKENDQKSRFN